MKEEELISQTKEWNSNFQGNDLKRERGRVNESIVCWKIQYNPSLLHPPPLSFLHLNGIWLSLTLQEGKKLRIERKKSNKNESEKETRRKKSKCLRERGTVLTTKRMEERENEDESNGSSPWTFYYYFYSTPIPFLLPPSINSFDLNIAFNGDLFLSP